MNDETIIILCVLSLILFPLILGFSYSIYTSIKINRGKTTKDEANKTLSHKASNNKRILTRIIAYFLAALAYGIIHASTKASGSSLPPLATTLIMASLITLATLASNMIAPLK